MDETRAPDDDHQNRESSVTDADICTSCGLCCTGALFLYGEVTQSELSTVNSLGLTFTEEFATPAIAFPCPAVVDRCCTVYAGRPQVCRDYRCEVLNSVSRGIYSGEHAIKIVLEAVDLAAAANDGYPGNIWQQRRDHLENPDGWREGPPETLADRLRRRLALYSLERFLYQHFRHPYEQDQNGFVPRKPPA